MGTRGYVVYRYKGYYFYYYNHWDSYRSGLGVDLVATIPSDPEEFKEWLNACRARFQLILEEWLSYDGDWNSNILTKTVYTDQERPFVSRWQPRTDLMIEYVYEMDLDWNTFHINNAPVYRLDNIPRGKNFRGYMIQSAFGYFTIDPNAPQKHRFHWKVDPPAVDNELLIAYEQHKGSSHPLGVNDILSPAGPVNANLVTVRQNLCKAFIVEMMINENTAHLLFELERNPNTERLPKGTLIVENAMLHLFTAPLVYDGHTLIIPEATSTNFMWCRDDICALLATHLDDENNLHSAIAKFFTAVTERVDRPPIVYGIVFSVFHCAIIRVDKADDTDKLFHTSALQFLPAWNTESILTPGIAAFVELCCLVDPSAVDKAAAVVCTHVDNKKKQRIPSCKSTGWEKIPVEIAFQIGQHLHDAEDVIHFAGISKMTANVATDLLRIPRLEGLELLAKEHKSFSFQAFDTSRFLSTVNVGLQITSQFSFKVEIR